MNRSIKYCTSLLLTFILMTSSNAQIFRVVRDFKEVEVAAGPSLVSLLSKNISNDVSHPKVGYATRVGLGFTLREKITIKLNFGYERKGLKTRYKVWHYDPTIDSTNCQCTTSLGETENNTNLDYFSVLPAIHFQPGKRSVYAEIGLFGAYLHRARFKSRMFWDNSSYQTNGTDN